MRTLILSSLSLCLLLANGPARAGDNAAKNPKSTAADEEARARAAKTACLSGDSAKGVALLAELYVETNDVNHLFNQGRCYEQNGKYTDAITRFREYQRKVRDAGGIPDEKADGHIADCRAMLAKNSPEPAAVGNTPADRPEVKPASEIAKSAPAPNHGRGLRIAGLTALAGGVAGLATGIILNVKANHLTSDLEASSTSYQRSKASTRSTYIAWGWVGYGVGAACLAGGALLYYLGYSRDHGAGSSVALLPAAGPDTAGAVLQGAF
jgi:hypothetical protein